MNNTRNAIMLGVVLTVGTIGMMGILPNTQENVANQEARNDAANITGHLIITVHDTNGNLKAYRQTDNVIVDVGKNCAPVLLFGATSPNPGCYTGGAVGSAYNIIAVSSTTSDPAVTATTLPGEIIGNGLTRAAATSVTVTTLASGSASETTILKAFTVSGTGGTPASAGLFNNDGTSKMFAGKAFTPVSVIAGDTFTVTWKIQLSG